MPSSIVHHLDAYLAFFGGVVATIVALTAVGSRLLRRVQWRLAQTYAAIYGAQHALKEIKGQVDSCERDYCPFRVTEESR